jgi:hypothetical protein
MYQCNQPEGINVIIAGSRNVHPSYFKALESKIQKVLWDMCSVYFRRYGGQDDNWVASIISGGARGGDAIGERYAKKNGIKLQVFPAEWDKYGRKSAGMIRNGVMEKEAHAVLAIWDGKSSGTRNMIERMHNAGKAAVIINLSNGRTEVLRRKK